MNAIALSIEPEITHRCIEKQLTNKDRLLTTAIVAPSRNQIVLEIVEADFDVVFSELCGIGVHRSACIEESWEEVLAPDLTTCTALNALGALDAHAALLRHPEGYGCLGSANAPTESSL